MSTAYVAECKCHTTHTNTKQTNIFLAKICPERELALGCHTRAKCERRKIAQKNCLCTCESTMNSHSVSRFRGLRSCVAPSSRRRHISYRAIEVDASYFFCTCLIFFFFFSFSSFFFAGTIALHLYLHIFRFAISKRPISTL